MKKMIFIIKIIFLLIIFLPEESKAQERIHATQNDKWLILTDGNDSLICEPILIPQGSVAITNNSAAGGEPIIKDLEDSVWMELDKAKYKMPEEVKDKKDEKVKAIKDKQEKTIRTFFNNLFN